MVHGLLGGSAGCRCMFSRWGTQAQQLRCGLWGTQASVGGARRLSTCHVHLILCHPLLLLPSVFPSIRVFSSDLALCIKCPKYWSFSFNFSISPSSEYSGLISFRIDWFDLLAVQEILKSLLQHHSLKASILWCSAFFIV